jgi:hypothetical protein
MKFSSKGIPILTLNDKLASLEHCLKDSAWEDAAGHLCDLLEHCRTRAVSSDGRIFATLRAFVDYYGSNPTPLELP